VQRSNSPSELLSQQEI